MALVHVGSFTVLEEVSRLTILVIYGFILVFVLQAFLATHHWQNSYLGILSKAECTTGLQLLHPNATIAS